MDKTDNNTSPDSFELTRFKRDCTGKFRIIGMKPYNQVVLQIRSQFVPDIRLTGITRLTLSSLVRRSRLVSYLVISKYYTLAKINQVYHTIIMKQQFNPRTEKAKLIALLMSEDVRS